MKRTKNVIYLSIRLNLDNKQHRTVYDILHNLDHNVFKSMNQFVVDAIEEKIGDYGVERIQAKEENEDDYKPFLRKDVPAIEEKIKREVMQEVENRVFDLMSKITKVGPHYNPVRVVAEEPKEEASEADLDDVLGDLAAEWASN